MVAAAYGNASLQHLLNIQLTKQEQHLTQTLQHKQPVGDLKEEDKADWLELAPQKLVYI